MRAQDYVAALLPLPFIYFFFSLFFSSVMRFAIRKWHYFLCVYIVAIINAGTGFVFYVTLTLDRSFLDVSFGRKNKRNVIELWVLRTIPRRGVFVDTCLMRNVLCTCLLHSVCV